MRRIIAIAGALALTAGLAVPAVATPEPPEHTDVVCHATSSEKNPYVIIFVDTASANGAKKLQGHMEHMLDSNKKQGADEIYTLAEWEARGEVCGTTQGPTN